MGSSLSTCRTCPSLTDDILIEIFAYLPLDSVYRFKSVSKVWASNLSDPNFITKWYRINNKSLPWIHYYSTIYKDDYDDDNPIKSKMAYPDTHSEFMSRNQHLFSFKFLMNQKPFQGSELCLLGSSNGLVLSCSVRSDDAWRHHVCNPLTQKWVSLPQPPGPSASRFDVSGIFCEYSSSFASCYKVVRIPKFHYRSKIFNADIFSSDLGVWRSFQVSCDEDVVWGWTSFDKVVILDGVLFRIEGGGRLLVYNLNQLNRGDGHRCSLINLPDVEEFDDVDYWDSGISISFIGESEGLVCCVTTKTTGGEMTMSVWVLDYELNWQILHKDVSINDILAEISSLIGGDQAERIQVLGFSPVDRNVVLLSWMHCVWAINILTRSIETLCLDDKREYYVGMSLLPFVLKPLPTVLPPPCWMHT